MYGRVQEVAEKWVFVLIVHVSPPKKIKKIDKFEVVDWVLNRRSFEMYVLANQRSRWQCHG